MRDANPRSRPLLSKLTRDPVALRRRSRVAALVLSGLGALAGSGWPVSGATASMLMAFVWFFVPFVASGIGVGDAFFLRHGAGQRRVLLTLLGGIVVSILSCVVLAAVSSGEQERALLSALFYFALIGAVIAALSALVAIGVGRGENYISTRIQDVDDRGW